MLQQQYCLRWKYHHSNLQTMFSSLLDRGCFCDVTLACEEKTIRAHRVVLCACSVYFDSILTNHANEKNPIIIMKDARFNDIKCLIEFMYKGEINVEHDNLASLLKTAEELKIKGLAEVSWKNDKQGETHGQPATAEILDTSFLRSTQNVYVKTFTNNNNLNSSNNQPSSQSPLLMYPKINTPVSLAQPEQMMRPVSAQQQMQMHVSPYHPMTMIPPHLAQINQMQQQQQQSQSQIHNSAIPHLTPLRIQGATTSDASIVPLKKKRGRPPLDGEFEQYASQMPVSNQIPNGPLYNHDSMGLIMEQRQPAEEVEREEPNRTQPNIPMEDLTEEPAAGHDFMDIVKIEQPDSEEHVSDLNEEDSDYNPQSSMKRRKKRRSQNREFEQVEEEDNLSMKSEERTAGNMSVVLTSQELAEWSDVVKMSDYLTSGRRPQFWEEPFTKRVLEAIRNKNLEMKKAAEVLGVSYGTLYGRYREVYGCLKHPYRGSFTKNMQNMWSQIDQSPVDLLNMLQRNAMSMNRSQKIEDPLEMSSSEYQLDHQNVQQQLKNQGVTLTTE